MNCPKCNNEMVRGFIQSSRRIIRGTKKHRLSFLPDKNNCDVRIVSDNWWLGAHKELFIVHGAGRL